MSILSTAQQNAVNSGITSSKVSQYDGYNDKIGKTTGTLTFKKTDGTVVSSFDGSSNITLNASSFFLTKMPSKSYSSYFTGPNEHREFYINIPKVSTSYFSWSFDIGSNDSYIKSKKCTGLYGKSPSTFTFSSMSGNTATVISDQSMSTVYEGSGFEFSYDGGVNWGKTTGYESYDSSYWRVFGEVMDGTKPSSALFRAAEYYYL